MLFRSKKLQKKNVRKKKQKKNVRRRKQKRKQMQFGLTLRTKNKTLQVRERPVNLEIKVAQKVIKILEHIQGFLELVGQQQVWEVPVELGTRLSQMEFKTKKAKWKS